MTKLLKTIFYGLLMSLTIAYTASAQPEEASDRPTVVFVHGLFADGSSWSDVIPILQARGINVVSVQNPLTSLADDVAVTQNAINLQSGPVILVGHSWGGVVITQAANNPKVSALVYVSAFAPGAGQSIADITAPYPTPVWESQLVQDKGNFLRLSPLGVKEYFAPDLPPRSQGIVTATQGPFLIGCLADKVTQVSGKPSWWVLPEEDQIIDPNLQAGMAAQINADVTKIHSSHVAMLSHPDEVARVILKAVASTK
jgi:pimeloyl-ACP methyl ester carboxylesterase